MPSQRSRCLMGAWQLQAAMIAGQAPRLSSSMGIGLNTVFPLSGADVAGLRYRNLGSMATTADGQLSKQG